MDFVAPKDHPIHKAPQRKLGLAIGIRVPAGFENNTEYKRIKRRHQEGIKKRARQSKNRPAVAANGLALAHRVHMRSMAPETPKEPSGPISGEPPMIVVLDINLFPVPLFVMYS